MLLLRTGVGPVMGDEELPRPGTPTWIFRAEVDSSTSSEDSYPAGVGIAPIPSGKSPYLTLVQLGPSNLSVSPSWT